MNDLDQGAPSPKLPLEDTIRISYAWFFQTFGDLLRMSWLCLLISAALAGLLFQIDLIWPTEGFIPPQPRPPALVIATTSMNLLLVIVATSIAVAWHRRIILDEQPNFSGSNIVTRVLWRTIMVEVALAAMAFVPPFATIFVIIHLAGSKLNIHDDSFVPVLLLFMALFIAGLCFALRFVPLLPARAVGNNKLTFAQAWQHTHGNFWRLVLGLAACALPPIGLLDITRFLINQAIWAPASPLSALDIPREHGGMVINSAIFAGYLLSLQISVGFLSQAYQHFMKAQHANAWHR